MKRILAILTLITTLSLSTLTFGNMPNSREATIIDAGNAAEVVLEATGTYMSEKKFGKSGDIEKNGVINAGIDAQKAAIHYLLYNGTDPILSNPKEQDAFDPIKNSFFDYNNIKKYITYSDSVPRKKVSLKDGTGIKITIQVKVDKEALTKALEGQNIIASRRALQELQGNPTIMVIPQMKKGQSPIEVLNNDENAKIGGGVIESFLTSKRYEVILPNQQSFLQDLQKTQSALAGQQEDTAYQLALSVGSDIYFDYAIQESNAAYETEKYAVTVRAYETTTARLLGSETGHSKARKGEKFVSIEEALQEALQNVLNRVNNYWKEDASNGSQFKIIFQIKPNTFSAKQLQNVQDAIYETLETTTKKSKENVVTPQTMDFVVWYNTEKQSNPTRKLWFKIRDQFSELSSNAELTIINQNRKMLIISIDPKKA